MQEEVEVDLKDQVVDSPQQEQEEQEGEEQEVKLVLS
jgi:hypothetical protein